MKGALPYLVALVLVALLFAILARCAGTTRQKQPPTPTPTVRAARTVQAQAGGGQDTAVIAAFLPGTLTVSAEDTVTWTVAGDAIHTVTFPGMEQAPPWITGVPGEAEALMLNPKAAFATRADGASLEQYDGSQVASSGLLSRLPVSEGVPSQDSFSLSFPKPGVYAYVCAVHPAMRGEVRVVSNIASTQTQEETDAQIKAEMAPMTAQVEQIRARGRAITGDPGPNGTTVWYLRAGFDLGDRSVSVAEFFPTNASVRSGDTVIWSATQAHTVTFASAAARPAFILPRSQASGPPLLRLNPAVAGASKPSGVYEPGKLYGSGIIGADALLMAQPGMAASWALTFNQPGVYEYFCAIHESLGMKGTITVQPR